MNNQFNIIGLESQEKVKKIQLKSGQTEMVTGVLSVSFVLK